MPGARIRSSHPVNLHWRTQQRAKVSIQECLGWNRSLIRSKGQGSVAKVLPVSEDESVILPDGTAGAVTPVIKAVAGRLQTSPAANVSRGTLRAEKVIVPGIGIERFVLQIVVRTAVQLVGARFQFHEHRATASGSSLSADTAHLHVHFLHRFHAYILDKTLQA